MPLITINSKLINDDTSAVHSANTNRILSDYYSKCEYYQVLYVKHNSNVYVEYYQVST